MLKLSLRLLPLLLAAACAGAPAVPPGPPAGEAVVQDEANGGDLGGDLGRLRRVVAAERAAFGADHPAVAMALAELAQAYADAGRPKAALLAIQQAAVVRRPHVVTERVLRLGAEAVDPPGRDRVAAKHVAIGAVIAERDPERRDALVDETFRAAQRVQASDVATAVARVAARLAIGEDELARLIREWLALVERRRALDGALLDAVRGPSLGEGAAEARAALRRELQEVSALIDGLNLRLDQDYPTYRELTNPVPASVEEVQRLLAPGEAMLVYAVLGADGELPREEAFAWLVRPERARLVRLDLAPGELDAAVRTLRSQLDPGQWTGDGPPPFDAALAHRLHAKLLPFGSEDLRGVDHLLVVPDGPLQSLPLAVLVRTPPAPGAGYQQVSWLVRDFATTTLPSVSSLRVLRLYAEPSRAGRPFRGVGDPVLVGPDGSGRALGAAEMLKDGIAQPEAVRTLPPLPETADELRALARRLRASEESLLLGEAATETAVKAGALADARVVAFATHAGVAGELPGLSEPALVLTPPPVATLEDDGLLTASEVTTLRGLDADFVVLSACNTAAPDGTPGAAGLSGLAKAFLYAGSRSLLVSHWAVISAAAERLTTGMFAELARQPGLARAQALRRAELALIASPGEAYLAHPAAWAPFVIVGDGGPSPATIASAAR